MGEGGAVLVTGRMFVYSISGLYLLDASSPPAVTTKTISRLLRNISVSALCIHFNYTLIFVKNTKVHKYYNVNLQ